MNEREALIPAISRIVMRYGVGAVAGVSISDDPDIILVVTIVVGLFIEAIYARDYIKRGKP